jgi:hypothetical protein
VRLESGAVVRKPKGTDGAESDSGRARDLEDSPAFTLRSARLSGMIANAVAAGMRAASNDGQSELLDRNAIARALGCSAAQVDKFRKMGMPCERFGQVPRFVEKACRAWIHDQKWTS